MLDNLRSPQGAGRFGSIRTRIVVADADEEVFALVRQLTAPDCFAVEFARTPGETMELLRGGAVEMAVVSVAMLDASPELVEELTRRGRRGLRVVVTNDAHCEASERRARTVSPVHYSPKPMCIPVFKDAIDCALRRTAQV